MLDFFLKPHYPKRMDSFKDLESQLLSKKGLVSDWFEQTLPQDQALLYSSVDIRDAGFKIASVDTNLFPAGFNNLCSLSMNTTIKVFHNTVLNRVSDCKSILIIAEEHTRNTWYLENLWTLQEICKEAGFSVKVGTFLNESHPNVCEEIGYVDLKTAEDNDLRLFCLDEIFIKLDKDDMHFDLVILNNDLSSGVPDSLKNFKIPILPSLDLGWHKRKKSDHFSEANRLVPSFFRDLGIDADPWLLTARFEKTEEIDISEVKDQDLLVLLAEKSFSEIEAKYKEHGISERPFLFLKASRGTYGMGIHVIHSPDELQKLNRKIKNKLKIGKSGKVLDHFILQEGIPANIQYHKDPSEVVLYMVANQSVGSFLRVNSERNNKENLNAKGMSFQRICHRDNPEKVSPIKRNYIPKEKDCGVILGSDRYFMYDMVAKLAGIAAYEEMKQLLKGP
ncbi:glutamate--cysteine ligase [Candidatus Marinamargulisbacteria bacterium SCGC AG-439-L15]|nr:glutamate--cysteine ligase [Candidatus Marinamargulisbacteria bacterium SCGC AG-439-L15]